MDTEDTRDDSCQDVGIAVILDRGEVLVTKRGSESHLGGMDEFPGGHRIPPESVETCVLREVREETGLCVEVEALLERVTSADAERSRSLWFFRCRLVGERPPLSALGSALHPRWIPVPQLVELDLPKANRAAIRKLVDAQRDFVQR